MNHVLTLTLMAAVPLRIAEIRKRGGPTDADFQRAKDFSLVLAEKGDILQFGGGKKGEVAVLFNRLADALAVMAFVPGGVRFDGQHWESKSRGVPRERIVPRP